MDSKNFGQIPGDPVFIGDIKTESISINYIEFNDEFLIENEIDSLDNFLLPKTTNTVKWINIYGLHDLNIIQKTGTVFNIHPLTIEDLVNTSHRPKFEEYNEYFFLILKHFVFKNNHSNTNQISIILKNDLIITFQETKEGIFEPIRERIRQNVGKIRTSGIDYLFFSLLDIIFENYSKFFDSFSDEIEFLENKITKKPSRKDPELINKFRKDIHLFRRTLKPTNDIIGVLVKSDYTFINKKNKPFFKDLLDAITHLNESVETYNSVLNDLMSLSLAQINIKMNEVMKILTIYSSIFIPLTFLTGVYGMNFEFFPELKLKYGYLFFWIGVISITGLVLLYFKKKKWL